MIPNTLPAASTADGAVGSTTKRRASSKMGASGFTNSRNRIPSGMNSTGYRMGEP